MTFCPAAMRVRRTCAKPLKDDYWSTKFALAAACELMDLGTLNDLVETVQNWEDDGALQLVTRLDALKHERYPKKV